MCKRAVCLLVALCLCIACQKKVEGTTVSTDDAALTVPADWKQVETAQPGIALAARSTQPTETIILNVNLFKEDLGMKASADEYMKVATDTFKKYFPDVNIIESGKNYWVIENDYGTGAMRQMQYYYTEGNFGYVLTFTASPEEFDANKDNFKTIEKSLVLK